MAKIKNNSFTLIETVIFMVIMAIVLTPFALLVATVMEKNSHPLAWLTATALAEHEMERVAMQRYSAINCEAPAAFGAPFTAYSYQVLADYVNPGDLNTSVGQPSLCVSPGGTITDYKKVQVKVTHAVAGTVTVTSLAANDW